MRNLSNKFEIYDISCILGKYNKLQHKLEECSFHKKILIKHTQNNIMKYL